MEIDANEVINRLNTRLADANFQIAVLETQISQLMQQEEERRQRQTPREDEEVDEVP